MNHPSDDAFREATCRPGQGAATCSFLILSGDGYECGKETASLMRALEQRRPGMTAQGDNCSGPPAYFVDAGVEARI